MVCMIVNHRRQIVNLTGKIVNRLGVEERAKILGCLVEGNSIRATCRMTGAAKGTVIKLLADPT